MRERRRARQQNLTKSEHSRLLVAGLGVAPGGSPQRAEALPIGGGNRATRALIQAQLEVGPAGDRFEQEADRVAAAVVRSIGRPTSANMAAQRQQEDAEPSIRRFPGLHGANEAGSMGGALDGDTESQIRAAQDRNRGIDGRVREAMDAAFQADFSGVKVHDNADSHDLAGQLHARAFTTGTDIFFGASEYQPSSASGQELLAHELTHVLQQNPGAHRRAQRSEALQRTVGNRV